MSQLQRQISQQIEGFCRSNPSEFPIIKSLEGKDLIVLPVDRYETLRTNDFAWRIVAFGIAIGCVAAGLSMLWPAIQRTPEPIIIREPSAPVVVDRGCIAFCGK